jgi:hypothetical protein
MGQRRKDHNAERDEAPRKHESSPIEFPYHAWMIRGPGKVVNRVAGCRFASELPCSGKLPLPSANYCSRRCFAGKTLFRNGQGRIPGGFMAIRVACPSCNGTSKVPEQYRGQTILCRRCQASFQVGPYPAPRRNPEPISPGRRKAPRALHSRDRSWGIWIAVALLGGVGLGSLVTAGILLSSDKSPFANHEAPTVAAGSP